MEVAGHRKPKGSHLWRQQRVSWQSCELTMNKLIHMNAIKDQLWLVHSHETQFLVTQMISSFKPECKMFPLHRRLTFSRESHFSFSGTSVALTYLYESSFLIVLQSCVCGLLRRRARDIVISFHLYISRPITSLALKNYLLNECTEHYIKTGYQLLRQIIRWLNSFFQIP